MNGKVYFFLTVIALAGGVAGICLGVTAVACAALVLAIVAMVLFYRSVSRTLRTICLGMDLLRSQDFASRLSHVGQKDADSMVDLYNAIISNLKEERLKNYEQECFLSKIIEVSPTGIAVCDFNGEIVRCNQAFKRFSSDALLDALSRLPEEGSCVIRPGGMQVFRCSRLFFMDRGFHRAFFLVERLTDEIVKAETSMFHKIVRTIGHEVNNTIGGVISVLDTLALMHGNDAEVTSAIASCSQSCSNLGGFVRSYSDIVKLPEAVMEPLDLNGFIKDSLPFLRGICRDNITLKTDLADGPVKVNADPMLLQRVVVNAIKNACESIASGAGDGEICIKTSPGELEIMDNGPGISPENADRIFSPFFSTKHPDRGLGLMLISDILRKHHATFSLATTPDNLTRLSIRFP